MPRVVIVGAGWGGCAAAVAVVQAGGEAVLVERADTLLGTGQVGGIMRNNGRFTAAEEMLAMGGGALFQLIDDTCRHRNVEFPGHHHASLYDVALMEPKVRRFLREQGVQIWVRSRATGVIKHEARIAALELEAGQNIEGDVFVDTTGTAGPQPNCRKYGNGCAMCILRCPTFGNRISITAKAGVEELVGHRPDGGIGSMSGSCKLNRDSVAKDIVRELERTGAAVIPVPQTMAEKEKKLLEIKCCQQYALPEFAENVVLLDTGHVKLMAPFYPVEELRQIRGLENARYEDPYSGGIGNSMRFFAMAPRDDTMKVTGLDNLFCAGEKAGLFVGHTEALCTGTLAGHNAVRYALRRELATIPRSTAVGEFIAWGRELMQKEEGLIRKFTFSGSIYFERMQQLATYTVDIAQIRRRVDQVGYTDFFNSRLS